MGAGVGEARAGWGSEEKGNDINGILSKGQALRFKYIKIIIKSCRAWCLLWGNKYSLNVIFTKAVGSRCYDVPASQMRKLSHKGR